MTDERRQDDLQFTHGSLSWPNKTQMAVDIEVNGRAVGFKGQRSIKYRRLQQSEVHVSNAY